MWVIGGENQQNLLNDVYSSTDGATWTQVRTHNAANGFEARGDHTSLVFDNKMWVIAGGLGETSKIYNNVWSSTDGATWTLETANAGFSLRLGHASVLFDERMWVLAGYEGCCGSNYNDAWSSTNGKTWKQEATDIGLSARHSLSAVVFKGKIWVMAGNRGTGRDIYSSTNGKTWKEETANAAFPDRNDHSSVVANNKIWVIGGTYFDSSFNNKYRNDVWNSSNGSTWTDATGSSSFTARAGHTSVVFDNKIWMIGGSQSGNYFNDVWFAPVQ
jgi:hypothetical protein